MFSIITGLFYLNVFFLDFNCATRNRVKCKLHIIRKCIKTEKEYLFSETLFILS